MSLNPLVRSELASALSFTQRHLCNIVTLLPSLPPPFPKVTTAAEFHGLKCIYHLRSPPIWVLQLDCEQRQTILCRERGHALLNLETRSSQLPKFISDHPTGVTGSIATFQRSASQPLKRHQRKKNRRKIRNTTIEQPNVGAGPLRYPQVFNPSSFTLIRQNDLSTGPFIRKEMDSQPSFTYTTNESSSTINTYSAKFETELEFRKIFFYRRRRRAVSSQSRYIMV
jgi:hypothetical protein